MNLAHAFAATSPNLHTARTVHAQGVIRPPEWDEMRHGGGRHDEFYSYADGAWTFTIQKEAGKWYVVAQRDYPFTRVFVNKARRGKARASSFEHHFTTAGAAMGALRYWLSHGGEIA